MKRNLGIGIVAIVVPLFLLKAYTPWQINKEDDGQTATSRLAAISANSHGGVSNIPAASLASVSAPLWNASASSPSGTVTAAASAVAANSAPLGNTPALPSSGVTAADGSQLDEELCLSDPYGCPCKESVSKITAPQGMSLVSANGCTKTSDRFLGTFIFKGEATLSGVIERNAGDMWDTIWFKAERPGKYSQFASAIYSLKLEDSEEVIGKLKLPALSEKSPCWAADVVIKVRELEVMSGFTDEAGNHPKDFEVLKIGKYRTCKRH